MVLFFSPIFLMRFSFTALLKSLLAVAVEMDLK